MVTRYKIEFSYSEGHIYDALNMKHIQIISYNLLMRYQMREENQL